MAKRVTNKSQTSKASASSNCGCGCLPTTKK
jgi:hypothetical protein